MKNNTVTAKTVPGIDVHCHYVPEAYLKTLADAGLLFSDTFPIPKWDVQMHLEDMDKMNLSAAILSLSSPDFYLGDKDKARAIARDSNEVGATAVRDHPTRFGFYANLPLPDVDGSLAELEYAYDVLKADGVKFYSNSHGLYLGQPEMEPIFAELNRRNAVVTMHPTKPSARPDNVLTGIPVPMFEFQFDTARSIANLIFNGIFDRYPNIKFVVPHCATIIPLLASRMAGTAKLMVSLKIKENFTPPDVFGILRNFYYDLAGGFGLPIQIPALLQLGSPDRFLYGSDYPFTPEPTATGLANDLRNTSLLTDEQRVAIFRDNAYKLFPRFQLKK